MRFNNLQPIDPEPIEFYHCECCGQVDMNRLKYLPHDTKIKFLEKCVPDFISKNDNPANLKKMIDNEWKKRT